MQNSTDSSASIEKKIELEILNSEKFQTLQKIRDFVTGDGAKALHYAIGEALSPAGHESEVDELEAELKDKLQDARQGAFFVNSDLEALAKVAIESEGDPPVSNNGGLILDKERRALLFIALRNGDAVDPIQLGVIEYLGGSDCSPEATEAPAYA